MHFIHQTKNKNAQRIDFIFCENIQILHEMIDDFLDKIGKLHFGIINYIFLFQLKESLLTQVFVKRKLQ